jgi:NDP-sugar pyrophosphorylase family protein
MALQDTSPAIETAIVLAGGLGQRLQPFTNDRPKAMVDVAGKPLLYWVLRWLRMNQVRRVVIGVAYRGEKIIEYFGNGEPLDLEIKYSTHTIEGGTVEGFRLAIERHVKDKTFFAMNGDEITSVKLQELAEFHRGQEAIATIAVSPLRSPYGVIDTEGSDIVAFREKAMIESVSVSIGVYVFQNEILDYLPRIGQIEKTTFPRLAAQRKLKAYRHNGFWMTVNTAKDLSEAQKELLKGEDVLCQSY